MIYLLNIYENTPLPNTQNTTPSSNKQPRTHSIDTEIHQKIPPTSFPFPSHTRNQESLRSPPAPSTSTPPSACGCPRYSYTQSPQQSLHRPRLAPRIHEIVIIKVNSEKARSHVHHASKRQFHLIRSQIHQVMTILRLTSHFHPSHSDPQSPSNSRNHCIPTPSLPAIPAVIAPPRTHSPNPTQTHVRRDFPPSRAFPRDSP